jgi:hypothetical protein
MSEKLDAVMKEEEELLTKAHKTAKARLQEITKQVADIERKIKAIKDYKQATSGKAQKGTDTKESGRPRAPKGENRQKLLDLIKRNPDGLSRREILEQLGLRGDKQSEASISNTLNSLKKKGELRSEGKAYVLA